MVWNSAVAVTFWRYLRERFWAKNRTLVVTPPTAEKPTGGTTGATAPPYLVRVKITNLNIHKGPGTNYGATGYIQPGIYTIVAESTGKGATKWGKLKSGAGWISLDYTTKT